MCRWLLHSSSTTLRRAGSVSALDRQSARATSSRSAAPIVFFARPAKTQQRPAHGLDTHPQPTFAFPRVAIFLHCRIGQTRYQPIYRASIALMKNRPLLRRLYAPAALKAFEVALEAACSY